MPSFQILEVVVSEPRGLSGPLVSRADEVGVEMDVCQEGRILAQQSRLRIHSNVERF